MFVLSGTELNTGLIFMKPIYTMHDITSSTTYAYTGVSVDIPVGSCYVITAIAYYNYGSPVSIGIGLSDTRADYIKTSSTGANGSASCTFSGFAPENIMLYVWASYNNVSRNTIYLRGFYLYCDKQ